MCVSSPREIRVWACLRFTNSVTSIISKTFAGILLDRGGRTGVHIAALRCNAAAQRIVAQNVNNVYVKVCVKVFVKMLGEVFVNNNKLISAYIYIYIYIYVYTKLK